MVSIEVMVHPMTAKICVYLDACLLLAQAVL
jgi:hypothetical protein